MSKRQRDLFVPPDHLLVAVVGGPHGVSGEVTVELLGENPDRLVAGSRLLAVGHTEESPRELTISSSRPHRGRYLVRFSGVDNRNEAESLRGTALCVPEASARPRDDQVWIKDLYGLEVVDTGGRELGRVVEVWDYPAQDVLEIETPGGRKLLPLVRDLVPEVDLESGRLVVSPPEGVFEAEPE